MANPFHVFASQDVISLNDDPDKNERKIQKFRSRRDRVELAFKESFKEEQLTTLSESLPLLLGRRVLKHFSYDLTLQP